MVKLFSFEHTFQHPFHSVTAAWMAKYPNDAAKHVKAIDITDRRIDQNGRLITNRIMSCQSALPGWLTAAGLPSQCFVAESSVVDPRTKTMVVKSSNLSGASLMVVEETCTYQATPSVGAAPPATHYKQEARITAFLPFLASRFESYSFSNLQSKSAEGVAVVEKLCQKIQQAGVLSLFKFDQPSAAGTQ
jgi:hypothetical protein